MRKVDLLRQLQELDIRIDTARTTLAQLVPRIGDRTALEQRAAELPRKQQQLHRLEAEQRDLELQTEERRNKIRADESKLYGGRVTNPKELASLSDEVAQDRRQVSALEDKLLALFERVDEASAEVRDLRESLAREASEWESIQQAARARKAETEAALASHQDQRTALCEQIDAADRATYESLRRQKGGIAVAHVQQRTCQTCRVALTPAQEQRARMGADLVSCHSCGRILYVPLA